MANNVRNTRLKKGLTQSQLAGLAGISRVAITKVELGKRNFSLQTAQKVAAALDVTIDELMRKENNP